MSKYIPPKINQRKKLNLTPQIEEYDNLTKKEEDKSIIFPVIDFSEKFDTIVLVFAGDWHLGAKWFDMEAAIETLEYVLNTPNARLFILGDMLNTVILNATGNIYEDKLYPQEQYKLFIDLFKQVAEQSKIAVVHLGNHEERIYKQTSLNIVEQAASDLRIKEAVASDYAMIKISIKNNECPDGKFSFIVITHHGNQVNFDKMQNKNQYSVLNVMGHWHVFKTESKTSHPFNQNLNQSIRHDHRNIILRSLGKTPFENSHPDKIRGAYTAIEVTSIKNPEFDSTIKTKVGNEEFIPAMRSIPIRSIAATKEKDQMIKACQKIIAEEQLTIANDFIPCLEEMVCVMKEAGFRLSQSATESLRKFKESSRKIEKSKANKKSSELLKESSQEQTKE